MADRDFDPKTYRLQSEITPVTPPEGVEVVKLHVRDYNGVDVLFTEDGKMLAGQGSNAHLVQVNSPSNKRPIKSLRASFIVDGVSVSYQAPVK